jgi:hypothetical protein
VGEQGTEASASDWPGLLSCEVGVSGSHERSSQMCPFLAEWPEPVASSSLPPVAEDGRQEGLQHQVLYGEAGTGFAQSLTAVGAQ